MKTKLVPSTVMLIAAAIWAVIGLSYKEDIKSFLWTLIIVMIIFYFLGLFVKIFLDKVFNKMQVSDIDDEILDNVSDEDENDDDNGEKDASDTDNEYVVKKKEVEEEDL